MTKEQVKEMVAEHNNKIDKFYNEELPKLLEEHGFKVIRKNGDVKIPMDAWFKANELIKEMKFYEAGKKILNEVRPNGFDVKMNMQSYKLVF